MPQDIFQSIEGKAILLAESWHRFKSEIILHLPESYHSEVGNLSNNLNRALDILIQELRHPTLILATTGTTSSGKSTLVNFLCGSDIVPTAVSEMSAGVVTIEYSETKQLIIKETDDALWECGSWQNIKDHEICRRLEEVMLTYIDSRQENPELSYPKFLIRYPFRVLDEIRSYLPEGVQVKILDLPGLSYVGDDANMEVIKQCREALCLVTYNSQETDPQKIRSLLLQVVEEVKSLGGSPQRMLFILNKIDVFRNDRDWTESENRFVNKTTQAIKAELSAHLQEYRTDIEDLNVVRLSTLPALISLQIQSDDSELSTLACRNADHKCSQLIERSILDDLPRRADNWSVQDRVRVTEDLWKKSYAREFQEYLSQHIKDNFPMLVIPQALERFNVDAANSIAQWAVQTTSAIMNSSEENYQQEIERINHIKYSLSQFLEICDANLRRPFEKLQQACRDYFDDQAIEGLQLHLGGILENAVRELITIEPYNTIEENLIPLYDWREAIGKGMDSILEEIGSSLSSGLISLNHPYFKKVDSRYINLLENNLRRLISLSYPSYAKYGSFVSAKTEVEKKQLNDLNIALNELSMYLSLIFPQILETIYGQEVTRMYESISCLFKCQLSHLEIGVNNIAPDIVIKFPESQLIKIKGRPNFNDIRLHSDFEITVKSYVEKKRKLSHWLFIVPKKTDRTSDDAKIPSIDEILSTWKNQLKMSEPSMLKQFIEWLMEQIDNLKINVDVTQNEVLELYQERLNKAKQEITTNYELTQRIWKPMYSQAKYLESMLSSISDLKKEEINATE